MGELSVYFCPKCGHYGYHQIPRNAICPKCSVSMTPLPVNYQAFMDFSCKNRDEILSQHVIDSSSPYVQRLLAPHKENNRREIIARMGDRITELEIENEKLNQTIEWMHQTIWDLLAQNKGMILNSSITPNQRILP